MSTAAGQPLRLRASSATAAALARGASLSLAAGLALAPTSSLRPLQLPVTITVAPPPAGDPWALDFSTPDFSGLVALIPL